MLVSSSFVVWMEVGFDVVVGVEERNQRRRKAEEGSGLQGCVVMLAEDSCMAPRTQLCSQGPASLETIDGLEESREAVVDLARLAEDVVLDILSALELSCSIDHVELTKWWYTYIRASQRVVKPTALSL